MYERDMGGIRIWSYGGKEVGGLVFDEMKWGVVEKETTSIHFSYKKNLF